MQSRPLLRWVAAVAVALVLGSCGSAPPRARPAPGPPPAGQPEAAAPEERAPAQVAPVREPAEAAPPPVSLPPMPKSVRVGLATDLAELWFPPDGGELAISAAGAHVALATALRVEPAAGAAGGGSWRLQVAALKDEGQARGLAATVGRQTGEPASVVFDAGSDLYRVRVGRYPSRAAAELAQQRLEQHNVHGSWIVSERGELAAPAFRISRGAEERRVEGRWLVVRTTSTAGIRVLDRRFRGEIMLYLNDRGTINVVNRVSLGDYLRGVVPREMGPKIYDDLDALKAQTVAARTYALKNMGEFADEGYDICATPRCQAYGGMDWEHELSDRAVAETAGEVLVYQGELADALYSSTCGGHTENVEVVFPLKREPYLRGVPCVEGGVEVLESATRSRLTLPARLAQAVVPPETGGHAEMIGRRFERLAALAGLSAPADRLASVERREVQRFVGAQFALALDARLFLSAEDIDYLLDHPPTDWTEPDLRLAAYLKKSGLLGGPLEQPLEPEELEETIFRLALFLRVIEQRDVRFLGLDGGRLRIRDAGEERILAVPARVATYRRLGEETLWAPLRLVAGDRLSVFLRGDELLAVRQEVDPDGLGYDRTSDRSAWTRFRSDRELAELVETRYPSLGFTGFEILARGVSGRVGELRLLGAGGRSERVVGLPIRWTLDLPDTLFTARRLTPPEGEAGWLFSGRGWGHGVGLCQVGAYGMALRGHGYEQILQHYYTGVELVRLEPAFGS